MAHLSADESLLDAFSRGLDVHRATAAEVFGSGLEQVSDEQRRAAKAINFGLIYGMSAFGLGKQLNIGRNEAQQYVDTYFERYPGVKRRDQGYVETVFGRRLYLPDINARNANVRQYAERTAINAPMQGTAADIIKRAMIRVQAWLADTGPECKMIMQVRVDGRRSRAVGRSGSGCRGRRELERSPLAPNSLLIFDSPSG
jgi:DNA polymerase-1